MLLISCFGEETEIDQDLNVACIVNLGIRSRPVSLVMQIELGLRGGPSLFLHSSGSLAAARIHEVVNLNKCIYNTLVG